MRGCGRVEAVALDDMYCWCGLAEAKVHSYKEHKQIFKLLREGKIVKIGENWGKLTHYKNENNWGVSWVDESGKPGVLKRWKL